MDSTFPPHKDVSIEEMTDSQLYEAYNHAKKHGPQPRLDELQLEVAQRWENIIEQKSKQ